MDKKIKEYRVWLNLEELFPLLIAFRNKNVENISHISSRIHFQNISYVFTPTHPHSHTHLDTHTHTHFHAPTLIPISHMHALESLNADTRTRPRTQRNSFVVLKLQILTLSESLIEMLNTAARKTN